MWGYVMLALFVGTGIFMTLRLKFFSWRRLGYALRCAVSRQKIGGGDVSAFQSLMTALAATVGTGNIVGVATALVLGGPGALVWMWISALFGMATKYSECLLSVLYRKRNAAGEVSGGPMYVMKYGFKSRRLGSILATIFSIFTALAAFTVGNMIQVHSITTAVYHTTRVPFGITAIIIAVLCGVVLMGGIKSIGRVCGIMVPFMAGFYLIGGVSVIVMNIENLGSGLREMFGLALNGGSAAGGVTGAFIAMRFGVARGVFSNEAGLGSAPIVAAAARTNDPVKHGLISMTGTFIDTLIVCTVTGLAIVCSGVLDSGLSGVALTIVAFSSGGLGEFGGFVVSVSLLLFAFSTIIGWEYYGEKAVEFLCPAPFITKVYKFAYVGFILFPVFFNGFYTSSLGLVWEIADIANALMALPNLICTLALSGAVRRHTRNYRP